MAVSSAAQHLTPFERSIAASVKAPLVHFGHAKKCTSLGWSAAGVVATGSSDATIRAWHVDPAGGLRHCDALKGHTGAVDALAWCPDAPSLLASGATDRSVRLWDTRAGWRCTGSVATKGQALSLAWTPDGAAVVMGTRDDTLVVVDVRRATSGAAGGSAVLSSTSFREELNEFAFSPASGLLFVGLGVLQQGLTDEGALGVFSLAAGGGGGGGGGGAGADAPAGGGGGGGALLTEVARVACHTAPITHLRFSPDGARLATGSGDSCVCLWDPAEAAVVAVLDRAEAQLRGLSWSRDGAHLAVASGDREDSAKLLEVLRAADGTRVAALACPAAVNPGCMGWAPHASLLAYTVEDAGSAKASEKPGGERFEAGALKLLHFGAAAGSA
jgi:WD40 repeat protein